MTPRTPLHKEATLLTTTFIDIAYFIPPLPQCLEGSIGWYMGKIHGPTSYSSLSSSFGTPGITKEAEQDKPCSPKNSRAIVPIPYLPVGRRFCRSRQNLTVSKFCRIGPHKSISHLSSYIGSKSGKTLYIVALP